jgi:hypothetical protein
MAFGQGANSTPRKNGTDKSDTSLLIDRYIKSSSDYSEELFYFRQPLPGS